MEPVSAPTGLSDRLAGLLCGPRWWGLLDVDQAARAELIADLETTVLAWIVGAPAAGEVTVAAGGQQPRQSPAAVCGGLR